MEELIDSLIHFTNSVFYFIYSVKMNSMRMRCEWGRDASRPDRQFKKISSKHPNPWHSAHSTACLSVL